ncbi:alpha/beta-hydrolase [Auriculariales sp. MPI-PUGE-AT-0066]|nr:alpha/beta-hydrolase [Auriculariales sp. MPI-PUGE-AT-0066]
MVARLWAAIGLSLLCGALATPPMLPPRPARRPLVVWHGMGDSYNSAAMQRFMAEVREMHDGIFIHSVYLEPETDADEKAGFFGFLGDQLQVASTQLAGIPELSQGFDALGFSQGGQFLRAYVEWFNNPPVHNLLTFGSQHLGVADIPGCRPHDLLCNLARNAAKSGVYTTWAQHNVIQAQYYRDERKLSAYLKQNTFLPRLNNEISELRNETYSRNLASLNNLVLIMFAQEKTVVPKESSWFGSYAPREGNEERVLVPMRRQSLYVEDWIGLRTLDEAGKVQLLTCDGEHMQLSTACLERTVGKYVGGYLIKQSALVFQTS